VPADHSPDITRLLADWQKGDHAALARLTPVVYDELRRLAKAYMRRERPGHTLQATALIHEAYVRLVGQRLPPMDGRTEFFGIVAHIMRQVLVDFARAHRAAKRGSGQKVTLDEALHLSATRSDDLLDLHEAIDRLAAFDSRKARVIELRYFGGLTREEVAGTLRLTVATVKRDLALAESWLRRELAAAP